MVDTTPMAKIGLIDHDVMNRKIALYVEGCCLLLGKT